MYVWVCVSGTVSNSVYEWGDEMWMTVGQSISTWHLKHVISFYSISKRKTLPANLGAISR